MMLKNSRILSKERLKFLNDHLTSSKLPKPLINTVYSMFRLGFNIENNGCQNSIAIDDNNIIIGKSKITVRKGNNNLIQIGNGGKFNKLKIDIQGDGNKIIIGDQVKFSGHLLVVGNNLSIQIGDKTTAIDCYVLARDKSVYIGESCMISRGIEIRATDVHKVINMNTNVRINPAHSDVVIGNHVWIAANVTVSKNVSISDGCIIAAGSFVNKSIADANCMIAGTPAKIIRQQVRWER